MRLEHEFDVDAPVDLVWATLLDVRRVAPCLPGASIVEVGADGTYRGTFTVKIGPTTASYNGVLRITEVDEATRTTTMDARGTDRRGQGGATATIVQRLEVCETGTRVRATTDLTITGKLARFGRGGMMQDVSNRLLREFAVCLQEQVAAENQSRPAEPGSAAEPIRGISLIFGAIVKRLRRLFFRR